MTPRASCTGTAVATTIIAMMGTTASKTRGTRRRDGHHDGHGDDGRHEGGTGGLRGGLARAHQASSEAVSAHGRSTLSGQRG